MNEIKIDLPAFIDRERYLKAPLYTHDTNYFNAHLPLLNREGIFKYLESVLRGEKSNSALSIYQASTYLDDIKTPVFSVRPTAQEKKKTKLIVSVYMDEIFQSHSVMRSTFMKLNEKIGNYQDIYLHLEYGNKTMKGKNIDHIHAFIELFSKTVKRPFQFLKYTDLIKIYDLRDYDFFEGNYVWFYGDSFFKHYCLSKGCGLLELFEVKPLTATKIIRLSPYHQVELGNLSSPVASERLENARAIGLAFFKEHQDAIREENYLLYKFLFSE